jgi:hypothetical protein
VVDPQSWNLYSYVRNRPMSSVDIGGKWTFLVHREITIIALSGYVSAGGMRRLISRQLAMDNPLTGGQGATTAHQHA